MEDSLALGAWEKNPLIEKKWHFLAKKLENDPELLAIPLANIERWMMAGRLADLRPLEEWRDLINKAQGSTKALVELLDLMRSEREDARRLKSCSPFPGVLTRDERDQFTCAWTH